MKIRITPFNAAGSIVAPPSKSFAHRYLIAAFLSGRSCIIKNVGDSDDVRATVAAIKALGAQAEMRGGDAAVLGGKRVKNAVVDCGESGSTMRFLIPVAAALGIRAEFKGKDRLNYRPVDDLARAMEGHGASLVGHTVVGKLKSGEYVLNSSLSSQFTTGLLFALSALDGESRISLVGQTVSGGYVDITLAVLKEFGVNVEKTETGFIIQGGYPKDGKTEFTVEGDWSGAAFPLALGALTGKVEVKNLKYPSLQPDCSIAEILRKFGAKVSVNGSSVSAERGVFNAIGEIDCQNFPDIAQVICSVAAFAKGNTTLVGVDRLKIKESDRIGAVVNTLKSCGISAEYDGKSLTVVGGKPRGGEFSGGKDHRTVMSAAVLAAAAYGESEIDGAEYFSKSYPEFLNDLSKLGGKIDVCI